ncbi:calcium homeostasis modulator protein 6-like [Halichoeres trimaculatus]|uniref:calcium homeostasis modulator protein 6-like n=1 Tax=Halichoeres trimaculatus TaxID=147232 RepID=UPI003D9F01C9
MDKFRAIKNIAEQQSNLGAVIMLTAGGQQIFSFVVFECPCSPELNFIYGMVFLVVPALTLLLLGYILSKKTWRLMTGLFRRTDRPWRLRRVVETLAVLAQITAASLVAPSVWVAVALLNGNYFECALTGNNASSIYQHLCEATPYTEQCKKELFRFPCKKGKGVPQDEREQVMLTLRAHSQILGWLLITFFMLMNLLLTCMARCTSPISYLQLRFWREYAQEENNMMETLIPKHAKELAERNVTSFFDKTLPEEIQTPSNRDWERISSMYIFHPNKQHYSTLHRYIDTYQMDNSGIVRMASVKSLNSPGVNPAVLSFVDNGNITL